MHIVRQRAVPFTAYGSIMIMLLTSCCLFQLIDVVYVDWFYGLAMILALLLGFFHVKLMNRLSYSAVTKGSYKSFLFTVLIVLISIILSGVLYFSVKLNFTFLNFQLAFVLPVLIDQAYTAFLQIPPKEFKPWYFPLDGRIPVIDTINPSETIMIRFVLSKDPQSVTQTSFTLDSPVDIPLGQLFFNLIIKYNDTNSLSMIQYANKTNETYGWLFFTRTGWLRQKNFIDPDLSFQQNNIRPNEIIYAVRDLSASFF